MYKKISDYGIIGNLQSIALVGLDGSIDWLCLPHIDSPSIFGALHDDRKGGRFSISPCDEYDSMAEYIPDTNILVTKFRTRKGILKITDFMPVHLAGSKEFEEERPELYRLMEVTKGEVPVDVVIEPRFDYARAHTSLEKRNDVLVAQGNGEVLKLSSPLDFFIKEDRVEARWRLSEGDRAWVHLEYGVDESSSADPQRIEKDLADTRNFWRDWLSRSETGRPLNFGPYESMVNRSALVLKLLNYSPTGTICVGIAGRPIQSSRCSGKTILGMPTECLRLIREFILLSFAHPLPVRPSISIQQKTWMRNWIFPGGPFSMQEESGWIRKRIMSSYPGYLSGIEAILEKLTLPFLNLSPPIFIKRRTERFLKKI